MQAPRLETERLVLRPLSLSDFDAYVRLWQLPEVVAFFGGIPRSRETSWSRITSKTGQWVLTGFGFFAIEEKASGRLIGEAGLQDLRREISPSIEGTLETGWLIDPAVQSRGYATEAVTAAMGWAAARFPQMDFSCIIHPDNVASIKVAEKTGFKPLVQTTYMGDPTVIFKKPAAQTA